MKITNLDTVVVDFYRTNLIFVRLSTDEGLSGIAEATLEGQEHAVRGAVAVLADAVRGKDPTRISQTIYELNRDAYWRGGPVSMTALSGLRRCSRLPGVGDDGVFMALLGFSVVYAKVMASRNSPPRPRTKLSVWASLAAALSSAVNCGIRSAAAM